MNKQDRTISPLSGTDNNLDFQAIRPRNLKRELAALYVGVSPSLFDKFVKDGVMPQPLSIPAKRTLWDKWQLDEAITCLRANDEQSENPWNES